MRCHASRRAARGAEARRRAAGGILLPALALLALPALGNRAWGAATEEEEFVLASETNYQAVAGMVDQAEMEAVVRELASYGSRVTGYPGYQRAVEYVKRRFAQELGAQNVHVETFPVVVPRPEADAQGRNAVISVLKPDGSVEEAMGLEPLWPNLVRTATTPRQGVEGRLIYAHKGTLREFNGLDVSNSIVLLDHNCGAEWYNAPLLGAKAVLFIEPEETIRGEAEQKFMSVPLDLPRFWVTKDVADELLGLLRERDAVQVRLNCRMPWMHEKRDPLTGQLVLNPATKAPIMESATGHNIWGTIRGSDPQVRDQQVVLHAYFDSMSVVPTIAPGAENAASIAALFQMMKVFQAHPPKRTILFLAEGGHFEGLSGTKWFIRDRIRGARQDKRIQRMYELTTNASRGIDDAGGRVWEPEKKPAVEKEEEKGPDEIASERLRALTRVDKALRDALKATRKLEKTIAKARQASGDDKSPVQPGQKLTAEQLRERQRLVNRGVQPERHLSLDEIQRREDLIAQFDERAPKIRSAIANAREVIRTSRHTPAKSSLGEKKAALTKAKTAVDAVTDAFDFSQDRIYAWYSLDLSTHNDVVGLFYKGFFYDYTEAIQWKFSDIGKKAREYSDLIAASMGVKASERFVDGINAIQGKNWRVYMAGKLALSSEVATLAGFPGLAFATIDDSRPQVDTPLDVPRYVDFEALARQSQFVACLLCDLINIKEPKNLYDLRLDDNFVEVKGRLVEFVPRVSTFPDVPVQEAIAVARTGAKTDMGVRAEIFDISTPSLITEQQQQELRRSRTGATRDIFQEGGHIHLLGLPNVRALGGAPTPVEGYLLDPTDGRVVMAPDMGVNGEAKYPIRLTMDQDLKPVTVVMFRCEPMAIFDLVDQRFFALLREINIYDAGTDAAPYEFGYLLPIPPQQFVSTYEPVALIYGSPGTNMKITMGASVLGLRMVLLNSVPDNPEGNGYLIEDHPTMSATPYRVALDMYKLDDSRIRLLDKHGVKNDRINAAHREAGVALASADLKLRERKYDEFVVAARQAWSLESRAYPDTRQTADDVVKGVLFYLFLLMPFAYFAERLFIAAADIKWQITGTFAIFLGIFLLLALVHPAFAITFTPVVILLSFIILALSVIVVSIIVRKFEEQMKEVKYEQTGIHTADVGRLSASTAAFNLGISNMRRRKTRTVLTSITLIFLTFTVLSCTSVVQGMRSNQIKLPKHAPYDGIMIRDKTWTPLGEPTTRVLRSEFGAQFPVAARAWHFPAMVGQQSFLNVRRGDDIYAATAMVGLTPEEAQINDLKPYIKDGRWFQPGDDYVCLVPQGMADKLHIEAGDVGNVFVNVFGKQLRVIGIVQSSKFKRYQDLDGEPLTPVDYLLMQEQQAQQQAGGQRSQDELREYIHLAPDAVLFLTYDFVMEQGGNLRSVAIGMRGLDKTKIQQHLNSLMERIELNIYAGVGGTTFLCSSVAATGFQGFGRVAVPILIAAMIVLNTMLGSVYERTKEIGIYSSLGLAPVHIAALFIAEACVYAILGAIAGYLFGQAMAKVLMTWHLLAGLNLNYSSLSAVTTTLIIMATVLASVIYPAKRASEIAVPGIERRWRLPEPEDDKLVMTLPFTVTGDQALGVNVFLREYLEAHADYSLGHFSTGDIHMRTVDTPKGDAYELDLMVWLAPYDLGVSERLLLRTIPSEDEEEVFDIRCTIGRESGDESSWMRVTRNFVNMLRKQYLLWRTFPAGLKAEYSRRGREATAEATTAAGGGGGV